MTRHLDPEDSSGITYRLEGRHVWAFQAGEEVDAFTLGADVPEGFEEFAVLARHHDIMSLGDGLC